MGQQSEAAVERGGEAIPRNGGRVAMPCPLFRVIIVLVVFPHLRVNTDGCSRR